MRGQLELHDNKIMTGREPRRTAVASPNTQSCAGLAQPTSDMIIGASAGKMFSRRFVILSRIELGSTVIFAVRFWQVMSWFSVDRV